MNCKSFSLYRRHIAINLWSSYSVKMSCDSSDMHASLSIQLKSVRSEAIFDLLEAETNFLFSYFEPLKVTVLTNCNVKDNQRNWLMPSFTFFDQYFMVIYGIEWVPFEAIEHWRLSFTFLRLHFLRQLKILKLSPSNLFNCKNKQQAEMLLNRIDA